MIKSKLRKEKGVGRRRGSGTRIPLCAKRRPTDPTDPGDAADLSIMGYFLRGSLLNQRLLLPRNLRK
ncbi:hypothetical protein DUT91_20765 [Phyllobacterium salinisoli]|uniref:Uncharacterized protein n=1 Tax=Phyllobacterium salinisoli TaxID=1899321 RepID=A0A368K0K5_9HYPH|nr:hypothetical protein DUT91_20765 [Phyllobacterium salinisoli]